MKKRFKNCIDCLYCAVMFGNIMCDYDRFRMVCRSDSLAVYAPIPAWCPLLRRKTRLVYGTLLGALLALGWLLVSAAHCELPEGMHLATEVRVDTLRLWSPLAVPAICDTNYLDSIYKISKERRK